MKKIINCYLNVSLILRILIALIIGAILGIVVPQLSIIEILGEVFVGALKGIAPILVFFLVVSAIVTAKRNIGSRFKTVIILYMISTTVSSAVAIIGSFLFPVKMVLTTSADSTAIEGISNVLSTLLSNMFSNPILALANANYMGILFWAVVFGIALKAIASQETIRCLSDFSGALSTVVKWIIQFAPFGVLGLVFQSVKDSGLEIFTTYGKLVLLLVVCMLVVALFTDPMISALFIRRNPYPLVFRCLKESGVTAFFTRSSAANIPVNMALCKKLGLDEDFYSVSIPLGATINMDGAAITINVMTLAVCHTLGIQVDIVTTFLLCILSTLAACGASGVAGGSLLLIPMACSLFGISNDVAMQAVAVGFIIGVIQDSLETAINSSGDVLYTATAEFHERLKRGEKIEF